MPKRSVHMSIDRMLFRKAFPMVHKILDRNVRELGPTHRRCTHNQANAALVLLACGGDPDALASAEVHLLTDAVSSELKKMLRRSLHA